MNAKFHGDSHDMAKAGLLIRLAWKDAPLPEVAVLPMFTEYEPSELEAEAYMRAIGIAPAYLVTRRQFHNKQDREAYFSGEHLNSFARFDLFVDPDTGVRDRIREDKKDHAFITFSELATLIPSASRRVVVVYDESFDPENPMKTLLMKHAGIEAQGMRCLTYFNNTRGKPSFHFVARERGHERQERVREFLSEIGIPRHRIIKTWQ